VQFRQVLLKRCLALLVLAAASFLGIDADAQTPAPQIQEGKPVDWWFVFKFNAKSFPACPAGASTQCPFGGEPSQATRGQTFVYASSIDPTLQMGSSCIGESGADPVGSTFGDLIKNNYFYVVWNDQFYNDPTIPGCSDSCSAPWGHSKGVLAWNEAGDGLVMQVTTPSWPGAVSQSASRQSGDTLGCISQPNNILVSQSFFAARLTADDVLQVLLALANSSVVTELDIPESSHHQLVNNGGPPNIQDAVKALGVKSKSTKVFIAQLSNGIRLLSKPSALHVPPWQLVSAELGSVPLRVASWWTNPAIGSTSASTPIDCWDTSLPKPGAVQIATSGSWQGTAFGLKGGPGPDFNHAKVGVSTSG